MARGVANGSRTLKYHKDLFDLVDGITQSFHFEFMEHRIDEYITLKFLIYLTYFSNLVL